MDITIKKHTVETRARPGHFFKYTSAEVACIILNNQTVRWNSPLRFNDPFDCYFSAAPKFDVKAMGKKFRSRWYDLLLSKATPMFNSDNSYAARHIAMRQKLHRDGLKTRAQLDKMFGGIHAQYITQFENLCSEIEREWKSWLRTYRILCVCEEKENLLLWSHYAKDHTGVVFQLECIKKLDVPLLASRPVIYSDVAPALFSETEWLNCCLGLGPMVEFSNTWEKLVTTKGTVWSYEKEWRAVSVRRDGEPETYSDTKFHPREISKIFLGCRIEEKDKTRLLNLIKGQFAHVEVYQTMQHPTKFSLTFSRM